MRLTLLALIGVLCLAYTYALDDFYADEHPGAQLDLLSVETDQTAHDNEGLREARQVWSGGYGGGGWGRSGWGGRRVGYGSNWGGRGNRWGGRRGWGSVYGR